MLVLLLLQVSVEGRDGFGRYEAAAAATVFLVSGFLLL